MLSSVNTVFLIPFRGEFEDGNGQTVNFDIQDVGGQYGYEFPPMWTLSVKNADAFVIVFSLDKAETWEEVYRVRDLVIEQKVIYLYNKFPCQAACLCVCRFVGLSGTCNFGPP